ncbi:hypothetical protein EV424DRAFT_1412079 [Suillus variegatus]|nr:hypothetical protein EV424DRAFT_1412079 [Suillus variegatus]
MPRLTSLRGWAALTISLPLSSNLVSMLAASSHYSSPTTLVMFSVNGKHVFSGGSPTDTAQEWEGPQKPDLSEFVSEFARNSFLDVVSV